MTQPVHWWPGQLAPAHAGVCVIGVHGDGERRAARLRIRAALREAVSQLAGVGAEEIAIASTPGSAPRAVLASSADEARRMLSRAHAVPAIAITHDGPLSLAAISFDGPVGIDLMRVSPVDDWRAVARDYLGPAVAAALEASTATGRPAAFARAWTEREARLKCLGLPLAEWRAAASADEARCRCTGLALPGGFEGALAIR